MDITKSQIRIILATLSYNPTIQNTTKMQRALSRFLDLLDNCPPHPIPEEIHEEARQICRILGEREKTPQERINQINKILAQENQNESDQNPE